MKTSVIAIALAACVLAGPVSAEILPSDCADEYVGGKAPDLANEKLSVNLREICFSQFGVFHSGITATPLFVGQRLTADIVRKAEAIDRNDVFHAEPSIPSGERAELAHYRGSGYDRGHMAPAADMATDRANDESFSLANMVPQNPGLNRGPWADIEHTTRRLATRYGEIYVVTGAAFSGSKLTKIGKRVIVPSAVYKAVYIPTTGQSSAWWADNASGAMEVVSVSALAARIGADVFPAVPASSKQAVVSLPLPGKKPSAAKSPKVSPEIGFPDKTERGAHPMDEGTWWMWALALLIDVLEALLRIVGRN